MTFKRILRLLAVASLATLAVGGAQAKTVQITPGDPIASVEVPDSWKVSDIDRGVQVKTPDEEVFVWFETYLPADEATVFGEHEKYFADQQVAITGDPRSATNDAPIGTVKFTDFPATWKGAPTVLRYISIVPKTGSKRILMSYWASPEGDKAQDAAMRSMLDSFAALP